MMGSWLEEELGKGGIFSLLAQYTFWQTSSLFQMICKLLYHIPIRKIKNRGENNFVHFKIFGNMSILYTQTKF